ncbi:MAG: SDR family oxidoreductase [Flavobacteriaceae bacterium]|nr:SDR family oxidoreductase [Flavobacteriaceae bacterium]
MVGEVQRWALVLGGSSGLGLATLKKLAAHGYGILMVHRDRRTELPRIEGEIDDIRALGVPCEHFNVDATALDKQQELVARFRALLGEQTIHVVVHSIAKGNLKPLWGPKEGRLGHADLQLTLNAMAHSFYDWAKALVDAGLLGDDARLLAFTSEGNSRAWPTYAAVSAAKAALEALMRNMALEFAPLGIKVNCIQAGVTDTPSFRRIPGHEQLKENALKRNPNKRLTTPEDVANVVYLMTLDEAKWITGTVIKADGGESLL